MSEGPSGQFDTEPVEDYRPGGFHPVHFGDLLHHGRYKIVRNSATVLSLLSGLPKVPCTSKPSLFTIISEFSLLTRDLSNSNSQYVAVNIKTAKASVEDSEQYILSYIS